MEDNTAILPKGTIVKLNGFPCELSVDTKVTGFKESKLDWFLQHKNQNGVSENHPVLQKDDL